MKGIALKLWVGMMSLVVLVIILLWFFQIVFLDTFYHETRIKDIKNEGLNILQNINNEDESTFLNSLDALAYNNNLTVELLDKQHKIIYSTETKGGQMMMMRNNQRIQVFESALAGKEALIEMIHPRFGSDFVLIGLPVTSSTEVEGVLLMTFPLTPVDDTVAILKQQLLYITVILLCMSLIVTFFLSRTFTKPIRDITNVSLEMASGNLSARVKGKRKDELGKLAETINYMGKELTKVDQLRKDLIANVSHELRTPLSLIKGYAETIQDVTGDNKEKREKQLGIIIEESDRLSKIVEDMLNLSQMQAGYIQLNISEFNLNSLLNRVLKRYEIMSESSGVIFHKDLQYEGDVRADESRIEQVLYNFINNAFNHSQKGDEVFLKSFEKVNAIRIEIADNGEGISEKELPYIWERFYKANQSSATRKSGSGLGLSIVQNILKAHDFNYGVESELGKGTTFWFEIKKE